MVSMDMRIRHIDPDVSRRFKALCQLEGKTLGEKLTELMWLAVKERGLDK